MNDPSAHRGATPGGPGLLVTLALALAAGCAAISTQSFWIDEGNSAWKAIQPTLSQWWQQMLAERGSDLQMPLYMALIWAWEKAAGQGEWALRAFNLVWWLAGAASLARGRWTLLAAILTSPFAWFYLNEARPYAMQMGSSLLVAGVLWRLAESRPDEAGAGDRSRAAALAAGLTFLSGSSLLGMLWTAAAVGAAAVVVPLPRVKHLLRSRWGIWVGAAAVQAGLAGYYFYTLKLGAGASSAGSTDARNALFIGFELLGFSGLGPGRLEVRGAGLAAFRPYLIPLAAYGLAVLAVGAAGLRRLAVEMPRRRLGGAAIVLGTAALLLMAAGMAKHFRVLGRHYAPLLPVVVLCLGAGLSWWWQRRTMAGRLVVVAYLALSLGSALTLRLATRHAKDDYRGAARAALGALGRGEAIWWSADAITARFYGVAQVAPGNAPLPAAAWLTLNCAERTLAELPRPSLVVCSKPDLYDAPGQLAAYLTREGYSISTKLPAFTLWRREGL